MMRALIVAFAGMLLLASPAMAQEAVGYWRGTLKLGEVSLRLGVKIERAADGALDLHSEA